jgi:sulfopyruvate decarboxylase TPP-binding subunit
MPLPNAFNVMNSTDLIYQLQRTPITPIISFASLYITNMYSNIPITETRKILEDITMHSLGNSDLIREILNRTKLLSQ